MREELLQRQRRLAQRTEEEALTKPAPLQEPRIREAARVNQPVLMLMLLLMLLLLLKTPPTQSHATKPASLLQMPLLQPPLRGLCGSGA